MECFDVAAGDLVPLPEEAGVPTPLARHMHGLFRALMLSPSFSCLGGAGAVRGDHYRFAVYKNVDAPDSISAVARDLARFERDRPGDEQPISIFVAAFQGPTLASEADFEVALWRHLDGLAAQGHVARADPPDLVEPEDPGFVFGDREFFVVGLSPVSSRWARRFGWPVLVFNALTHARVLKADDRHGRLRRAILARDRRLQGSDNPSLAATQQAQFSGRAVGRDWRKPTRSGDA